LLALLLIEKLFLLRSHQARSVGVQILTGEILEHLQSSSAEAPPIFAIGDAPNAEGLDLMAEKLNLLIQFEEANEELIDVGEALLLGAHDTEDLDLAFNEVGVMCTMQLLARLLIFCVIRKLMVGQIRLQKISKIITIPLHQGQKKGTRCPR
jgi:hypothetical protein